LSPSIQTHLRAAPIVRRPLKERQRMNIEALAAWFQRKQKPEAEVEGRE
jgi:hypothetical protein